MSSELIVVQRSGLADTCGAEPGWVCEQVYEATGNEVLAKVLGFLQGTPLRILVIVALGLLVSRLLKRAVERVAVRISARASGYDPRVESRVTTIKGTLRVAIAIAVWAVVLFTALGEAGINLGPVIAGAGIAGLAIGFGAQNLVRDVVSGLFILAEDQFGVGDFVDLGEVKGTVEAVSLRTSRIRALDGTLWFVPNGTISSAGNGSRDWRRVVLDVGVGYNADITKATEVIQRTAEEVCAAHERDCVEPPTIWGVQSLDADAVTIRLVVKAVPGKHPALERALNAAMKDALDAEGIEIPFPQRTVWLRQDA